MLSPECRNTRAIIWRNCDRPPARSDKTRSNVAEDQRVVILAGLVSNNPRIGAARRSELVLSNIGDPGCYAEEESLNGKDVNSIDHGVAIHISSIPPASCWDKCDIEEMPLHGEHIYAVDARGARRQSELGRRDSIAAARSSG